MVTRQRIRDYEAYPEDKLENHHAGMLMLDRNGDQMTARWVGGTVIGITADTLEQGSRKYIRRDGDLIHIAQFTVKILGVNHQPSSLVYICQRVGAPSNGELIADAPAEEKR